MRLLALFFLAFAVTAAATTYAPANSSAQSSQVGAVPIKQCGTFTGPTWQFPGTSLTSNKYAAYVIHYSCAKAKKWAKKFGAMSVPNKKKGASNKVKGPKGFKCLANPDARGHAFAGSCKKGSGAKTIGFGWGSGH